MIRLTDVAANAFIELYKNGKDMVLSMHQLYQYSNVVTAMTNEYVDFSGAAIMSIRLDHFDTFNLSNDNILSVNDNISFKDLEARYRSNISYNQLEAYTSKKALNTLGIDTFYLSQKRR